jgi:uncharacterized membrane protein HdeD (DUF308 family)
VTLNEVFTLIIAVIGLLVALANSTDEGRNRVGRCAKLAITQAIFLVFIGSSIYNVISFFRESSPPTRSEIGMLILNVINALAWTDAWFSSTVRAYFRFAKNLKKND